MSKNMSLRSSFGHVLAKIMGRSPLCSPAYNTYRSISPQRSVATSTSIDEISWLEARPVDKLQKIFTLAACTYTTSVTVSFGKRESHSYEVKILKDDQNKPHHVSLDRAMLKIQE